jgi:hypothetical protein
MNNGKLKRTALVVSTCAALAATGCADMNMGNMSQTQKGTAVGAGVGALAGAAIGGDTRGAVVGGLLGGKKGAIVGGAVAGGAGTAVVLSTRGKDVRLPRGSRLSIRLLEPLTVRVPA